MNPAARPDRLAQPAGQHRYCWVPLSLDISLGSEVVDGARGRCWATVLRARPGRDENERTVVLRLSRARKTPRDAVMRARTIQLS